METYIVRVWMSVGSAEPEPGGLLRGVVRHVQTGRERSFVSWEELQAALVEGSAAGSTQPASAAFGEGKGFGEGGA